MTENPYESPRGISDEPPDGVSESVELPPPTGERWRFILLGASLALGLISYVPWLAVVFAILSAPVFLRSYLRARRADPSGRSFGWGMHGAGIGGSLALVISIFAASAGVFLGTCTATLWVTVPPIYFSTRGDFSWGWILICGGVAVGALAFVTTSRWLFRRLW